MGPRPPQYTALARRWGDQWDVFVLDTVAGLIGSTTAATFAEVEDAARTFLGEHLKRRGPAHDVRIDIVRR